MLDSITQISKFPIFSFIGSKNKLLFEIWEVVKDFKFNTVLDLFSGTSIVSYMFKAYGKQVIANDFMFMNANISKALIENSSVKLTETEVNNLMKEVDNDHFVTREFKDLYYIDKDNVFIDNLRTNIFKIENEYKRAIALSALIRACIKKRPRGIFTYVGNRYDDGRKDYRKSLEQQFREAVKLINNAVFDNYQTNCSLRKDALLLNEKGIDLVYMDPPYESKFSDNDYVRRYHFVEGLARNWQGVKIEEKTKTKKFKSYKTAFATENGTKKAFDHLFSRYKDSILLVSYSSNAVPSKVEMIELIKRYKHNVKVVSIDYQYSINSRKNRERNKVKEYLFLGY